MTPHASRPPGMGRKVTAGLVALLALTSSQPAAAESVFVYADAVDTTHAASDAGVVESFPPGVFPRALPGAFVVAQVSDLPCSELPLGATVCGTLLPLAGVYCYAYDPGGSCCGLGGAVAFHLRVPLTVPYDETLFEGTEWNEADIGLYAWSVYWQDWVATNAVIDTVANRVTVEQASPVYWYLLSAGPAPHKPPGGSWTTSWGRTKIEAGRASTPSSPSPDRRAAEPR